MRGAYGRLLMFIIYNQEPEGYQNIDTELKLELLMYHKKRSHHVLYKGVLRNALSSALTSFPGL